MSCLAAGALLVLAGAAGCGNQYRPVISPVTPTGPAAQPSAFTVVFSQPQQTLAAPGGANPCSPSAYANPGIVTLVDFSGDSIIAQAQIGQGPISTALDGAGSTAYAVTCDAGGKGASISTVPISTQLQTKNVGTTTLLESSIPATNMLVTNSGQYVTQLGSNTVGAFLTSSASAPSLNQEIPVAPSLINVTGIYNAVRVYAISQGNSNAGGAVSWGQCDNPSSVTVNGEADGIEVTNNTVSSRLPLGICPVYGVGTLDGKRTFIMNRGSGTVTVIDSQKNVLDTQTLSTYLHNATIPVGAGPVSADLLTQGTSNASLLVTANYDSNTVSIINVALDVFGNDSPNFGQVLATIPVGKNPSSVTILGDGSRAYVANEGDGTVSVINLTTFTVQKTIPVNGHPRSIVSTYNAPIGKVYTVATDSSLLTIIRTDVDAVSATVQLQGNGIDARTTTQFAGSSGATANQNTQSRSMGSGEP
ncbi:MAG: YncE family protein [Acidobacteria bacterium]|nr:YncE family protein [Acidobacteriota bacterium]